MTFLFSEYPYKFTKVLKSQQAIEKDTITLLCELDDAAGDVKWLVRLYETGKIDQLALLTMTLLW